MSVEKVTKVVNKCVCELPDCPGKRKPWFSPDEKIPIRCKWCHRSTWRTGVDHRRKDQKVTWARVRQCTVCGGTTWTEDAKGRPVCAHCAGNENAPKPSAAKETAHAPGCTCTLCRMKRAEHTKPKATKIHLPKPTKTRNRE